MKLYYKAGACSLAPHIALEETGTKHEIVSVDLATKKTENGDDYFKINPKGSVPALQLDNGAIITEGVAIMQYVADQTQNDLSPAQGSLERARLHEALNFIASEVHKAYAPLFRGATDAEKPAIIANLDRRLGQVEDMLKDENSYLVNGKFSLADGYLFVATNWSPFVGHDLAPYKKINALRARVAARPAVQAAMKAEGLI